jgi:flavin reductase (DIM6/NTAB) family NADH-FMN oxidoreductase RutF
MKLEVDLRVEPATARLLEPEVFDDLRVELVGAHVPLAPQLTPVGIARFDEHAWVRVDALRELAGEAATPAWERSLAAMLDHARAQGWVDDDLGAVRAHCERRLPEPDEDAAGSRPAEGDDETFRPELFRDVIGRFATGVAVITATRDDTPYGMTASAVASLSLEPPMLLVCLNRESVTHGVIEAAGAFGVNVLRLEQAEVARRFAGTDRGGKFSGLEVRYGPLGAPLLAGALARLECEVAEKVTGGTHTVFLGTVRHAESDDGDPLTYFRGRFGRFHDAHDALLPTEAG